MCLAKKNCFKKVVSILVIFIYITSTIKEDIILDYIFYVYYLFYFWKAMIILKF